MATTLLDIKTQVATLFQLSSLSDLTILGRDAFLDAVNKARNMAELAHDFEFNRQIVTLTVDGVTGGDLSTVVLQGTSTNATIKTLLDVGTFDEDNNFLPQFWTTVGSSQEQQRAENPQTNFRYPTDGQVQASPSGRPRFIVRNNKIFRWPADTNSSNDYSVGLEAYVYTADWTSVTPTVTISGVTSPNVNGQTLTAVGSFRDYPLFANSFNSVFLYHYDGIDWILAQEVNANNANYWNLATTSLDPSGTYTANGSNTGTPALTASALSDTWTTYGHDYLLWQTIVILNHRFKEFVPRTEGNLPPPTALAQAGLEALLEWDAGKFARYRRSAR